MADQSTMKMRCKVLFRDALPPALFVSHAAHTVFEIALLDCQFARLTQNAMLLHSEVKALSRALDNYTCIQRAGWYTILDTHFNGVCQRHNLYAKSSTELVQRDQLTLALSQQRPFEEVEALLAEWSAEIFDFLKTENAILRPFEDRLLPEISVQIFANGGNDWEWFLWYLITKLEKHRRLDELATLALQLQAALKRCSTPVERARILPAVARSMTAPTLERLLSVGFSTEPANPPAARPPKAFSRASSMRSLGSSSRMNSLKSIDVSFA
mmetsp:Transcript_769/g.2071  ORF Transcript_769/g.2071 Transcript_769/m.2071 type:complete len:270 (+) Transcript_769:265-1074(+)